MAPANRLGRPRRASLRSASLIVHSPALTPEPAQGLGLPGRGAVPHPGQRGQRVTPPP